MIWIVILVVLVVWLRWHFVRWVELQTHRVSAESKIIQTTAGRVEYDLRGTGPVVLHFHGGNVGHNGWFMLEHVLDAGFTLLTPDRPGYLGTPLADNGTSDAQAEVIAALLDALNIDSVAVVGISAGGPAALQFALRYPERTNALILLSAITRRTELSEGQVNSALGRLVMSSPKVQNVAYFLINQAMKRIPALALQDYVRTETTYDMDTGKRYIRQILDDPLQRKQVMALADAIVPALPRFDGVMNDLHVQQRLPDLPLRQVQAATFIVHSRHDGDAPYDNATHAAELIPNVELITVDQFGHMIWWGDPEVTAQFQTQIENFLRAHLH
jgi:pimeloyl-ACP methyl ester carboxylesterase